MITILHLEDDAKDAELVQAWLESAELACQITCVQTREAFGAALRQGGYAVILADYQLPGYDGLSALHLAREQCPEIPFIFVSGMMGEDAAIEGLMEGATDYVFKQKLSRLAPAVKRALCEAENRRERQRTEAALRKSETLYRSVVTAMAEGVCLQAATGEILAVNPAAERIEGRSAAQMLGRTSGDSQRGAIYEDGRPFPGELHPAMVALRTGEPQTNVVMGIHQPDGALVWISINAQPLVTPGESSPYAVVSTFRDITARKQAEEQVRYQAALLANVNDAIVASDENDSLTAWNAAAEALYGWKAEAVLGRSSQEIVQTEYPSEDKDEILRAIAAAGRWRGEATQMRKDGTRIPVEVSSLALHDENGRIAGYVSVNRDITERKRAEQERLAHLRFFESLDVVNRALQSTNDLEQMMSAVLGAMLSLFNCDRAWLLYPCDPEAPSFRVPMEMTRPEYPGAKVLNVDVPMSPGEARNMREALEADAPVTYIDGTERPVSTAKQFGVQSQMFLPVHPKLGKPWVLGLHQCSFPRIWTPAEEWLLREIGRRLADGLTSLLTYRDLRESENRYRRITEGLTDYQYSVRVENGRAVATTQSSTCTTVTGYTAEEFAADPYLWFRMVAPEDRALVQERVQQILAGKDIPPLEHRLLRKDGEMRWVSDTTILHKDASGSLRSYDGVIKDITERKRAEETLRQSEMRFRQVVASIPEHIYVSEIHREGQVVNVYQSSGVEALTGYPRQRLMDDWTFWLETAIYPADREAAQAQVARLLADQASVAEYRLLQPDGNVIWVRDSARVETDPAGVKTIYGVMMDITERKQAEEALHQSEERLRAILDATPFPIALVDAQDNHIDFWSHSALALFGHTAPTASEWYQLAYPDPNYRREVIERWKPVVEKVRQSTQAVNAGEYRVACRNGSVCICELYVAFQADHLIVTFDDITARKQAEAALKENGAFLDTLLNAMPVPIFYKDAQGHYLGFNKSFELYFGKTPPELIGKSVFDIAPRELAEIYHAKDLELLQHPGKQVYETQMQDARGEAHAVVYHKATFTDSDGQVRGLIGVMLDITERKQAEAALRRLNAELELRVEARTAELYQANEALRCALRVKDEFLMTMSHELRTPLTAIMGMAELLQTQAHDPLTEKQAAYVQAISTSGQHLLALITDVLDVAKIAAGQLKLGVGPVSVAEICQAAQHMITPQSGKKQITLSLALDPAVIVLQADARRLKQILVNLLGNAVKFTPVGGQVGLAVSGDEKQQVVNFTVWDTGIGITAEDLPRLFQDFVQLDARFAREYEGTGLGLALVRRLAELHGGQVKAESQGLGKGCQFTVSLPWEPVSPAPKVVM